MALQLERVGGVLTARVRPKIIWVLFAGLGLMVVVVLEAAILPLCTRLLFALHQGANPFGVLLRLSLAILIAAGPVIGLVRMFSTSERILVTESSIEVVRFSFGRVVSERSIANSTVKDLRYEEWNGGEFEWYNGIRLESRGHEITFALRIGARDAGKLMDAMREVFEFPLKGEDPPERSPAVSSW